MVDSPVWSSPVLQSVSGVIERSRHVTTHVDALERVASWMAYEEFTFSTGPSATGTTPPRSSTSRSSTP